MFCAKNCPAASHPMRFVENEVARRWPLIRTSSKTTCAYVSAGKPQSYRLKWTLLEARRKCSSLDVCSFLGALKINRYKGDPNSRAGFFFLMHVRLLNDEGPYRHIFVQCRQLSQALCLMMVCFTVRNTHSHMVIAPRGYCTGVDYDYDCIILQYSYY